MVFSLPKRRTNLCSAPRRRLGAFTKTHGAQGVVMTLRHEATRGCASRRPAPTDLIGLRFSPALSAKLPGKRPHATALPTASYATVRRYLQKNKRTIDTQSMSPIYFSMRHM